MRRNHLYVVSSALALAACGGGGGGSSGSVAVVPGPAAPATSAPTPAASPTPTYTYASFDLSRDRVFGGQVATASDLERYTPGAPTLYTVESQQALLEPSRGALELAYSANKSLVIRFRGEVTRFDPADISYTDADGVRWGRTRTATARGDVATFARYPNLEYVYLVEQQIDEEMREPNTAAAYRLTNRYFLVGERTRDGDLPTVGTSNYGVDLATTSVVRSRGSGFSVSGATLTIDHASGAVNARLDVRQGSYSTGTTPETATLIFSGTVSANGISGTITSPDGRYTGVFTGDLFGSRGVETGLVFTLSGPDGVRAAGRLVGRRRYLQS